MAEFGSRTEVQYAALIGDVVSSRSSADREELQRRLLHEVESLSDRFGAALVSPLALFRGDEIQGLIARPEAAVDLVVELSESIVPDRLSFGLGYGALTTEIDPDVARIDGPCFHRARAALEDARGGDWVIARGFGPTEDPVVTALFSLMGAVRGRWTEKQLAYARAARGASQRSVAERFGVSASTVSESLATSSATVVRQGEEAAKALLGRFGPDAEPGGTSAR